MSNIMLQEYSVVEMQYSQLILENSFAYDRREGWDTFRPSPKKILRTVNILLSVLKEKSENYVYLYKIANDAGLVLLDFSTRHLNISIASSDKNIIDDHIKKLKAVYPPEPEQFDDKVKVRFWYNTNHGPRNVTRTISVPRWETIENNYHPETVEGLNFLMGDFKPSSGVGQLIIMSGEPGTGKSYYLRSLLYQWRDWCSPEYILDPEQLFSGGQGYMANLVLEDAFDDEYNAEAGENPAKWKLLILEDSGELIKADAKAEVGQGLARLLNLVDGLIGQGLRVLVLITTNEDISKFHEAVVREGRCAAKIIFSPLEREQALKWLPNGEFKLPNKEKFTLSELFALTKTKTVKQENKHEPIFGFQINR